MRLVLVGGGHAHLPVLAAFCDSPPPDTELVLVVDQADAVYSGMVPGFVAGQYRAEELRIDVARLARRAGGEVILHPAAGVDVARRCVRLAGGGEVSYDLLSMDIGSTVAGLELPGVRQHAVATRPIGGFVAELDGHVARATAAARPLRVAVVGGGAAGVELAFTVQSRLLAAGAPEPRIVLVESGPRLLPGSSAALARAAARRLGQRGIEVLLRRSVESATDATLRLSNGEQLQHDLLLWAAGAAPHPGFGAPELARDERGFFRVRPTLQVEGDDSVFAAGDCASLSEPRATPKAGVHAVRQGPVLRHNLWAQLAGQPLRRYRPQRDFLTLLNLGDGRGLGGKWGIAFHGRWVMRWKDRIDRRFVARYRPDSQLGAAQSEG